MMRTTHTKTLLLFTAIFSYYNLFFIQYQILFNGFEPNPVKRLVEIIIGMIMFVTFSLYFYRYTAERGADSQSNPFNRRISPIGKGEANE